MTILTALLFALAQADPSPAPLEPRVSAYALQLRDETTRDRARDRLVHLGRPALALLEKFEVDPLLVSWIRQEVAQNETIGAAYAPPHLFTFDAAEETLGILLSRLETGAGVTFIKNSLDLAQKFSVPLADATFWEALDAVCSKAAVSYHPANDQFYLNSGMASPKPRVYYGPLMIIMDRVTHQRKVTFEKIEAEFVIKLSCFWERSTAPLGPTGRFTLARVTDDTGASLIPANRQAAPPRPMMPMRFLGQGTDLGGLLPPSPGARNLSRVEGTLELEFPARVDEVKMEIKGDAPQALREIEGAQVELRSFTILQNSGATAEFQIKFKDSKEAANFRIANTDVEFTGPGKGINSVWIISTQRDAEKGLYLFTARWHQGGRQEMPKEIRLRIPRGSVIKNVPFCYRDVELK
jgi:hypothetical protein